jgi:transposase
MPVKNYLKLEQKEMLQKALKEEENPDIRERILILLLLNDGKTQADIADFIGCGLNKVNYWCIHGDPENMETLKDKRMEGNHRKATDKYIEILLETVEKEPEELGYEFGRWTAKRWVEFIRKGDKQNFYEVMKEFYQDLISEWVAQGNDAKDFAEKGAKIVIILDNASFHKNEEINKKIEAEMPNIRLEFLPTYSPDYNLIELVWHSTKEYVANRLFTSIEDLELLLHRLLNEGELIIQWHRKLKNKGNSIKVV